MSNRSILLGYEVGSGRAVHIPVRHMGVIGLTQISGKTTTLDGLIGRSGLRAVSFVTKRGEASFGEEVCGRNGIFHIPAFFRPGCDWQAVTALLEAHLGEKLSKNLRPYLMRACENHCSIAGSTIAEVKSSNKQSRDRQSLKSPGTVADVACNLRQMEAAADGKAESIACFTLAQYFATLLPELAKVPSSATLTLQPGLNIMDLGGYGSALQALVIGSTLDWISEHEDGVITIIPEAWEFIPREGDTPCKQAVIRMARKGGCLENFVWVDSQDLASIDTEVRKMLSVYLLGVQRERNEVIRTLNHIPANMRKPTARAIMELNRGEFWAAFDQEMRCCYVQPPWLDDEPERAREYARYRRPASFVAPRTAALTAGSRSRRNKNKDISPSAHDGAGTGIADAIGPAPEAISGRVQ